MENTLYCVLITLQGFISTILGFQVVANVTVGSVFFVSMLIGGLLYVFNYWHSDK